MRKGDEHIGRILYLQCVSEFEDTVGDTRKNKVNGVIVTQVCTSASGTKGGGVWKNVLYENRFNGTTVYPSITDNGNGSITLGNDGYFNLSTNVAGSGIIENYNLTGGLFTLTDNTTNYIVANYNSGSPAIQKITDVTLINETTIVPIYSIYRNGNYLHTQRWDSLGLALANKVHQSIVKTQRYRRESGLTLSESGTRNLNLTAGIIWTGGVKTELDAIASATDNIYCWSHSSGAWVQNIVTQYNNLNYDNGTNLVELTANRYAVNWIYRGVEMQKHLYCVVGTGDYTLAQAQLATIPQLPPILGHTVLVAKIIVQKSSNTAYSIQSAFDTQFGNAGTTDHTSLTNLAWASSGHTGTANKYAGFDANGVATYLDGGSSSGGIWTAITGTRTANTTFTLVGDQTAIFTKGLIVRWLEGTTNMLGMVVSSAYSSVTTVTIIGDTCGATAATFKYTFIPPEIVKFVNGCTLGSVGTNIMNNHTPFYSKRVLGVDPYVEVSGTTNSTTFDINVNGTSIFSTKPTLASTVRYAPTPFTANSGVTIVLGDSLTVDLDAVQTTPAVGGYLDLYTFPTRLLNIS